MQKKLGKWVAVKAIYSDFVEMFLTIKFRHTENVAMVSEILTINRKLSESYKTIFSSMKNKGKLKLQLKMDHGRLSLKKF